MIKKVFAIIGGLLLGLMSILFINTLRFNSKQVKIAAIPAEDIPQESITRLQAAVRIPTISFQDTSEIKYAYFDSLHNQLELNFPLCHKALERNIINKHSLLYVWQGTSPGLLPVMLLAHQDVVPVDDKSLIDWEAPPFSSEIKNNFIYGRGTIDIKSGVTSNLEAVELLLKKGYKPKRTVMLAFGHDEEIGGQQGAVKICKYLAEKNIELQYVIDEGGSITSGIMPGISNPVAIIGIAEKGYVTLELTVDGQGGHSSMPEKETTLGILAGAVSKLEKNPFPAAIKGAAEQMFEYAGPEMGFAMRMVFANKWLFEKIILSQLEGKKSTAASIRTTTAPTIIHAGTKENVIPSKATATVNFRILPGETGQTVLKRVVEIIADSRIKVSITGSHADDPSPISDTKGWGFKMIQTTIGEVFPDVIVAPYLMLGATDARHYIPICKNIFRFQPTRLADADLERIHGTNERISIENYKETVRFYMRLIENSTK